jgi:hypothetical protein
LLRKFICKFISKGASIPVTQLICKVKSEEIFLLYLGGCLVFIAAFRNVCVFIPRFVVEPVIMIFCGALGGEQ